MRRDHFFAIAFKAFMTERSFQSTKQGPFFRDLLAFMSFYGVLQKAAITSRVFLLCHHRHRSSGSLLNLAIGLKQSYYVLRVLALL